VYTFDGIRQQSCKWSCIYLAGQRNREFWSPRRTRQPEWVALQYHTFPIKRLATPNRHTINSPGQDKLTYAHIPIGRNTERKTRLYDIKPVAELPSLLDPTTTNPREAFRSFLCCPAVRTALAGTFCTSRSSLTASIMPAASGVCG